MFFLHKPSSLSNSYPPLQINGNDLHFSVSPSSNTYRSPYSLNPFLGLITSHPFCSKSRKILGFIFCHFYKHSSPETIIRLYISLVRPILEYCSPVWSPSSPSQILKLESIHAILHHQTSIQVPPPPQPLNLHLFSGELTSKHPVHYLPQLTDLLPTPSSQILSLSHLPHPFLSP